MKRAALLACGLLALGACDRERREPWFIYSNGNLHCSGGGSSVKPDTEAIEETGELIDKAGKLIKETKEITKILQSTQSNSQTKSFPTFDVLKDRTLVLRIDGDFGKAAKACADFLARAGSVANSTGNTESGRR